jgi:hypothetical protein
VLLTAVGNTPGTLLGKENVLTSDETPRDENVLTSGKK